MDEVVVGPEDQRKEKETGEGKERLKCVNGLVNRELKGAMSHNTHARANENKLEKDSPTFSSCVGDFGRPFLSV